MRIRVAVRDAGRLRQPRYTPEACRRMVEALVAQRQDRRWADLTRGAASLVHCTGPWPELADCVGTLIDFLEKEDYVRRPYALLAVAGLAGDKALRVAAERLCRDEGPIAVDEIVVLAGSTRPTGHC